MKSQTTFFLGCNYWASNAGTEMWLQYDETVIRRDMQALYDGGVRCLRVFPNWRDFQPVQPLMEQGNRVKEYGMADGSAPKNPYYLDPVMLERFHSFCRIAAEYEMELIVGIVTGWMSGRLFTPLCLGEKNLFTDPEALWLEQLFVKGFVQELKDEPAIFAWDLGNECNCMSRTDDRRVAAGWTAMIANAIRAADASRMVISGMHGLAMYNEAEKAWRIEDQAETCDMLTTHPYPFYVRYAYKDNMTSFRTRMHATAETQYYADLGKKPCMVEEIGNLGPMSCGEPETAVFLKTTLYSAWVHGSAGVLWWCAFEQMHLTTTPYTWNMNERELGLLYADWKPKPLLSTVKDFHDFLQTAPKLPKMQCDGVVLLTHGQDPWGMAYMTMCLAKKAGVHVQFANAWKELPDSDVYVMPSICGNENIRTEILDELLEKVYNGATLYLSSDDAFLSPFRAFTGVEIANSGMTQEAGTLQYNGKSIPYRRTLLRKLRMKEAKPLALDAAGEPVFTVNTYGKGKVYFLNYPMEKNLLDEFRAFDAPQEEFYKTVFAEQLRQHPIRAESAFVGLTLHPEEDGVYAVLVNYGEEPADSGYVLQNSYHVEKSLADDPHAITPGGAAVLYLKQ